MRFDARRRISWLGADSLGKRRDIDAVRTARSESLGPFVGDGVTDRI
jgi:hypothetical protein